MEEEKASVGVVALARQRCGSQLSTPSSATVRRHCYCPRSSKPLPCSSPSLVVAVISCCGAGGGGSMFCNTSNQVACMGDIYDVVDSASGSGSASGTHSSLLMSKSLHPDSSLLPFNSSVGDQMAAAAASSVNLNMRVPLTAAQLQELKRQTVIFEYMMA